MNEGFVVLVRGIVAFFSLLIFARLLGKQQVSQLTFFDYVLGITIGSSAATLTSDLNSAAWPHWIGVLTWTALLLVLQFVSVKSKNVEQYLNGKPSVIIINGKIMEDAMKKMRYSLYDLQEQLRSKDVFDVGQVEFAVLETNGELSVLKKSQFQPVTPKDMNITTEYMGLSTELIFNGFILDQNLQKVNLNRSWLQGELKKKGITDPSEVFYATLDTNGNLFVDTYRDHMEPSLVKK